MKFLKKNKFYLLSFFVPILISLLVLLSKSYIISKTLFKSDMLAQYIPFFSYYKNLLIGKKTLFYSFSNGLGGSMMGTFSYYLASPLNLLIVFFPLKQLPLFVAVLLLLKIGLCGLTMYIYLNHLNKNNNYMKLSLSLCYSLMAYVINYYFNIMWLDSIYMLPLVILGIDKIFEGKKPMLYGITLFLTIFMNYYIGYMICIFSCLYFIYKLILEYKSIKGNIKKYICRFIITSLLAGLMTFIILIPTFIELQSSDKSLNTFLTSQFEFNYNLFDLFSKGYVGSYNEEMILNFDTVNWYIGILPIILLFNYFFNKKVVRKEKILSALMIVIFVASFSISHLNYIWHGFNMPIGFNYRYSFIFCFFLIIISFKGFSEFNLTKTKCLISLLIYLIISIIVELFKYSYIKFYLIWISVALFGLYTMILYLKDSSNEKQRKMMNILLCFLVIGELSTNCYFSIRNSSFYYNKEYVYNLKKSKKLKNYEKNDKSKFIRIDMNDDFVDNNGLMYNYNGFNTFNSTLNKKVVDFISNNGFTYFDSAMSYGRGNTILLDSLLSLKYKLIYEEEYELYSKKEQYKTKSGTGLYFGLLNRNTYIYENPYYLELGFMVNNKILNYAQILLDKEKINNFEYQNIIFNTMLGNDDEYLKEIELQKEENGIYEFKINNGNDFYLYAQSLIEMDISNYIDININDESIGQYYATSRGVILIKNKYKDSNIKINYNINGNAIAGTPLLYYLDDNAFKNAINNLKENQLIIDKFSDSYIRGHITSTKEKNVLFTSIPYNKGWSIYVDGKKVKRYKLYDCFIGAKLKEGEHKIELKYYPPGLNLGACISGISLVIFIVYMKFMKE